MKKKIIGITAWLLSFHFGHAQPEKAFTLHGKFAGQATGYVYLYYPLLNDSWLLDSSKVTDGAFVFKGKLPAPTVARLSYARSAVQIILEPAVMQLAIHDNKDITKNTMTGSRSQLQLAELNTSLKKIDDRWKIVIDTLNAVNRRSNAAFQELKGWVLDPYFKEQEEVNHNFINKYPASVASAHILQIFARELSADTLQLFYDRFPASVKQSRYGKNIARQLQERKLGIPGTMAAGFTKTDINGNKLSLADLQGKYVLLDFWGSWCVPCRKGNPHLIGLYQKYKSLGFEIVGIAADDATPDAWRKAVAKDQLPWLQVLQGNTPAEDIGVKYSIASYPTKILVDKNGKIIGRFGEEHEPLDAMLEKLFK